MCLGFELLTTGDEGWKQCDQNKIAKCLSKLPKKDFTRKMMDFDTFTKNA